MRAAYTGWPPCFGLGVAVTASHLKTWASLQGSLLAVITKELASYREERKIDPSKRKISQNKLKWLNQVSKMAPRTSP
jgi:hypothetical protein